MKFTKATLVASAAALSLGLAACDSPQEEELGAHPGADPDEIDAYQTESARVLLDLVEAFIRDKQAGAA